MELGPRRESYLGTGKPKRRNSLGRVFILTALILFGLYVVSQRQNWLQPFAPTPTPTRTAASYFDEAEVLYREGKLDEAIVAYRNAYQYEPESWIALSRLVRLTVFRNQAAEAIEEYGEALKAFDTAETYAVLCLAYDWNGQYEEALAACVRAVSQNPDDADAHAYMSEVYSDLGKWDEAYDEATKALELDERSVEAYRAMAYALEVRQDYEGAVEAYQRAIELHPRLSQLYSGLARNHRVLGDYDLAVEQFQKAVEVDPNNPEAYDQLGWTYFQMADSSRAVVEIKRALEVDPDYAPAHGHLGAIYMSSSVTRTLFPTLRQPSQAVAPHWSTITDWVFPTSIPTPTPCRVTRQKSWSEVANWESPGWTRPWNAIPIAVPVGLELTSVRERDGNVGWTTLAKPL